MRVVAKPYKSMENVHGEMLGFAVADLHGGTCATVFRKSAEDMAGELNHPWTMVLAYAAAHEVGHLVSMVRLLMALMIVYLLICGWGFGFSPTRR
jgi:hypothetical protein